MSNGAPLGADVLQVDSDVTPENQNEIMQLTRKEYNDMVSAINKLTNIVNALSQNSRQAVTRLNELVEAINHLPENGALVDAIAEKIIGLFDGAQARVDDGVAQAIAERHLVLLEEKPAAEMCDETVFEAHYANIDTPNGEQLLLHVSAFDPSTGAFVSITEPTDEQKVIFHAIAIFMTEKHDIEPNVVVYIKHNAEAPGGFDRFVDQALNGQGALGDMNSSVVVSQDPMPDSLKFVFREQGDVGAEKQFTYEAFESVDQVHWSRVELDSELMMFYVSCVQNAGGRAGETWYVKHQ